MKFRAIEEEKEGVQRSWIGGEIGGERAASEPVDEPHTIGANHFVC
jgi:hypothetical protein